MIKLKILLKENIKSIRDIIPLIPTFVNAAQIIYNNWDQSNPDEDDLNGGGICQDIAEEFSNILNSHGFEAQTIDSNGIGDQHVWTVFNTKEGIYQLDIPYSYYETGSGYSWKKRPNVEFTKDMLEISHMPPDITWDDISNY